MSQTNDQPRSDREESGLCRRRGGRLRQESICSNLGPVLDLAPGGARVLTRSRPGKRFLLTLADHGTTIGIVAELAWTKRRGLFRYEVGLRFIDVSAAAAESIKKMCMLNRVSRYFHKDQAA